MPSGGSDPWAVDEPVRSRRMQLAGLLILAAAAMTFVSTPFNWATLTFPVTVEETGGSKVLAAGHGAIAIWFGSSF